MTTQWNPTHTGDAGRDRNRAGGEGRESGPASRDSNERNPAKRGSDTSAPPSRPAPAVPAGETASYQSGPWRGYTMPVPEHPEHAEQRERAAEDASSYDPPAYDGITGYPDPSGAGSAQSAPQGSHSAAGAPTRSDPSEAAKDRQQRFGRHARSAPQAATDGNASADRRDQGGSDHDDPDGLAATLQAPTGATATDRPPELSLDDTASPLGELLTGYHRHLIMDVADVQPPGGGADPDKLVRETGPAVRGLSDVAQRVFENFFRQCGL